jgi:hypothetical protein
MARLIHLLLFIGSAYADPGWFQEDTKSPDGWTFYCKSNAKNEGEALSMARAECSRKMCMLFGVEVKVEQKSVETLKDAESKTTIIESCPNVRIVGKTEKKKLVDCSDDSCDSFVSQFYSMKEYELEKKRLDNPPISPALEKTIIVREGNDTFKDPKKCRELLSSLKTTDDRKKRVTLLGESEKECLGLDYRNVDLQTELNQHLFQFVQGRGVYYAGAVMQQLSTRNTLIDRIAFVKEIESHDTEKSLAKAQEVILSNYDSLFFRMDHGPFYLTEVKECSAHSKIIRAWPRAFFDTVSVCSPNKVTKGKDCQSTSITMLRAAYAGCICRNQAPEVESPCTMLLITHMNEKCPLEMNEDCFRSMSSVVAEKMKVKINPINK